MLAVIRQARAQGERHMSSKWLARVAVVSGGAFEVGLSVYFEALGADAVKAVQAYKDLAKHGLPSTFLFLLRQLASQGNAATLGRMLVELMSGRSLGAAVSVREELASIAIRSRSIDYVVAKSAIGGTSDGVAQAMIESLARRVQAALPRLPSGGILPDVADAALEALAESYDGLRRATLERVPAAWSQDDCVEERARESIGVPWLRSVFKGEYGPTLGIMQGEWRSRAISDPDAGDDYFDFYYERTAGDRHVQFDKPKRDRIRLYLLCLTAYLVERERARGEAAMQDLAVLLRRRDGIDDPRTLLFGDGADAFETTTRDVINTERALWIKSRLQDEGAPVSVLEVGAGYGHLTGHLLKAGVASRAIIVDRPLNLVVAKRYLDVLFPGRISLEPGDRLEDPLVRLVPPWAVSDLDEQVDLLVNFISFQHMGDDVLRYYDQALRRLGIRAAVLENWDIEQITAALSGTFEGGRLNEVERETRIFRPHRIDRVLFSTDRSG